MPYKRNRTQSLTVRLTQAEKERIQSRAAAKKMSVTDYLLLSVLQQSDAVLYQPLLQRLGEVKEKLTEAADSGTADMYDALELHEKVCNEIMKAIRKGQLPAPV